MSALIRSALLSAVVILIAVGCASVTAKDKTVETIKPSGAHEDCFELLVGQGLEYSFETSKPVNFNIHYHADKDIVYPIQKNAATTDKGTFVAKIKQYYCLMWTNPNSEQVTLKYDYTIRDKQQ